MSTPINKDSIEEEYDDPAQYQNLGEEFIKNQQQLMQLVNAIAMEAALSP